MIEYYNIEGSNESKRNRKNTTQKRNKFILLDPMLGKELLQSLVNDSLVETDKIGIANFFWALPSRATQQV